MFMCGRLKAQSVDDDVSIKETCGNRRSRAKSVSGWEIQNLKRVSGGRCVWGQKVTVIVKLN